MMRDKDLTRVRRGLTEVENDLIDELAAGRIGRREFLRHGTVLGLTLPVLSTIAGALGFMAAPTPARAAGKPGGTIRVATSLPAGAIDPVTVDDNGGLQMLLQTGEFLCVSGPDLRLRPMLAESWKPNADGSVWTFKLRQGIKFQNGEAFNADSVVSSFSRLADPASASNALSAFKGILPKDGTRKVDDYTIEFHVDQANGNFPYLVSSDNYNAIMLPPDYAGDFEKNFIGTGPFMLDKYTPKVGASFVRNPHYWGKPANPDRVEWIFYQNMQAGVLALQGNEIDIISQVSVQGAQALLNDPKIQIVSEKTSAHQQVHMRCDMDPFGDKRVRQAVGLCIDRAKLVKGLFRGRSDIGNDNPFAPVFPSTDKTVAQRHHDIAKAKALMAAAGHADGFTVKLTTEQYLEIPDYAIIIQNAVKPIGINIQLNVESQDAYYGKAVFGQSDWLDSVMGITDYGHRGVPNVFLTAPLKSEGTWNSAHFKNPAYDSLVGDYIKALDLGSQRAVAGKIQRLLLDETPILFTYFYDYLTPAKKNMTGISRVPNRLFMADVAFT